VILLFVAIILNSLAIVMHSISLRFLRKRIDRLTGPRVIGSGTAGSPLRLYDPFKDNV
jgi:hypothetical protein